jgi:hypothetical protein
MDRFILKAMGYGNAYAWDRVTDSYWYIPLGTWWKINSVLIDDKKEEITRTLEKYCVRAEHMSRPFT